MAPATGAAGAAVVVPPVEIDVATAPVLERQIAQASAQHPAQVVVDCGDVTFCDSSAVSVLVDARSTLRDEGCDLVVVDPPALLCRVAAVLGQAEHLGIPAAP